MKTFAVLLVALLVLSTQARADPPLTTDSKFPLFTTAIAAQHHCPFDFVVWLDVKSDTYRLNGPPPDAVKGSGAYMCQRDADQMDYQVAQ